MDSNPFRTGKKWSAGLHLKMSVCGYYRMETITGVVVADTRRQRRDKKANGNVEKMLWRVSSF